MTVGEWRSERQRSEYNGTNRNYSSNRRNDCYSMVVFMSSFNWCHGPSCHKSHTQDRVRGSKGSKVLRTRKVKQQTERSWYNPNNFYNYFCSNGCYNEFANAHIQQIIRIAPRTEPLETPINDPKKDSEGYYNRWVITERGVDTSME